MRHRSGRCRSGKEPAEAQGQRRSRPGSSWVDCRPRRSHSRALSRHLVPEKRREKSRWRNHARNHGPRPSPGWRMDNEAHD